MKKRTNPNLEKSYTDYFSTHVNNPITTPNNQELDQEYIKQQLKVLDNNTNKIPNNYRPQYENMYAKQSGFIGGQLNDREQLIYDKENTANLPKDRYDAFGEYLYNKGLLERDNVPRYISNYVNIDSAQRNKVPKSTIEKWIDLNNAITLDRNTRDMIINIPKHNFEVTDKISITNVSSVTRKIKVKVNNVKKIDFENGSQYMTIYDNPEVIFSSVTDASAYDNSDMFVIIENLKGFPGSTYIENIPLNTIIGRQNIILVHPEKKTYFSDRYYIKLITKFSGTYDPPSYNIVLTYLHIGGVPINRINAEYPINASHLQGFHVVKAITKDTITVELIKQPATSKINTGGNLNYVGKITNVEEGFVSPSEYTLQLNKVYTNIISVRLVSSEFPNTEKVIKSTPESKKNNKLYWQNLDDGDYVYSIELNSGNYTPDELSTEIQNLVFQVPRISAKDLGGIISDTTYTDSNFMRVAIDTKTDIVTFRSFKQSLLVKPFIQVDPPIDLKGTEPLNVASFSITINQKNHGLSVNDIILISGAIAYFGIPAEILNTEHAITEVIDKDRYKINVSHFNVSSQRSDSGGGSAVTIFVPNIFRLRFDYPDTFGRLLGFRNTGTDIAITKYNTSLSNIDLYEFEQSINESGEPITVKNNSIILSGDNYILITCQQINGIFNGGKIKNALAKILLSGIPGKVLFNTYVNAIIYLHEPILQLTELDLAFYTPDGELYDFNGLDHSFMLELTSISEVTKGTGITSRISKII
jgi:hypothetical protein